MPGNCLLIISKNEGINPLSLAEEALQSDVIDKVIISDGSNEETFKRLKEKENKTIEVIHEKTYVNTTETGKGVGMINGGIAALKQGFDNIAYMDGDIFCPNIGKWFPFLFEPLERGIDIVKVSFSRNPTDGQITRHITKPLIAMFFPNAWEIDQPLGGELSVKAEVLKDVLSTGIKPPYGWGIDTFITIKSLIYGHQMGEVYLGQKMHNKKTLTHLKKMFVQCFEEAVRMTHYFYQLQARKKIKPLLRIASPFKMDAVFDEGYMDIKKEIERSLPSFNLMKKMYLPHDDIYYRMKDAADFNSFYNLSQQININNWVELLYWFVKKYDPQLIDQYYLRWKIRALSFCLHEINTVEQAENRTTFQAKTASNFIYKIGGKTVLDNHSKKVYFYQH